MSISLGFMYDTLTEVAHDARRKTAMTSVASAMRILIS